LPDFQVLVNNKNEPSLYRETGLDDSDRQ